MSVNLNAKHVLENRNLHRAVLDNGMVVLAAENSAADIIAARIFIRAGSRYEPQEQAGLSHLLTSVLTKGTDTLTSLEIAERVESVGASLGADSAADYCILSLKTVSGDFVEMLSLAAQILRSPSFPEAEIELERRLTLQGIRSMKEQPFSVAQRQLRMAMYQHHPYALPGLGLEETVAQLNRDDVKRYHHTYFRPDNIIISIVGRIAPDASIALVDRIFGDWQIPTSEEGKIPLPTLSLPEVVARPQRVMTSQETQQAIVMLGYLAASVHSQDYVALKLLNTYLGNGLSSRLFVELREKRGLAYEVSAFYPTRIDTSQFVVYMGTAPSNTAIAVDGLHQEVNRLYTHLLSPEELQAAKNKLLGQYALGKQTNAQIAQIFGWYEALGLGIGFDQQYQDQVFALTADQLQETACRYFAEPFVSLVGPAIALEQINAPVTLG